MGDHDLLSEQVEYYRARANEYDAGLRELNRYASLGGSIAGPTDDAATDEQLGIALSELDRELPVGEALEIACGTGWWTQRLAARADAVTAMDSAPEMVVFNRERVAASNVTYVVADVFSWEPNRTYDLVFFSFWLSHVPETRFDSFWELVSAAAGDKGRFFLIDELENSKRPTFEEQISTGVVRRRVDDGRTFRAVKVYHQPAKLQMRLNSLGWDAQVTACGNDFYFGRGSRRSSTV